MPVADFLKDVGKGVATVGRVAGAVAEPLGRSIAEEEAGYAPEIAKEKRERQYAFEDAQIDVKAKELENQLAIGEKYGTLTPEDRQKYIDAITGLYSHPRHAATLMEKLRKAVHPNGAVYTPNALSSLKSAVPESGTAEADEQRAERLAAAKYHGPAGKSPPAPGNQLPPDAVGPDGQPVPPEARNAAHSFVEWNGAWWPVAKPKPQFKTIKGHSVLVDSQSGAILRDLGPVGTAKVTTRQTLQPGDDGQMHMVNLTSVTTPEGTKIDVEPESTEAPTGESKPTAPASANTPVQPKPGGVARVLKPQVKPVANPPGGVAGPVVPGFTSLAHSKNPLYKSDMQQYTKAAEDAQSKQKMYEQAQGLLADNTRQTDLELVFSWVRSNVQGAGRMTNTEINQAASAGSFGMHIKNAWTKAATGRLAPEMEQQFLSDIKRAYETAQKQADELRKKVELPANDTQPTGGGDADVDAIMQALKGKPKTP